MFVCKFRYSFILKNHNFDFRFFSINYFSCSKIRVLIEIYFVKFQTNKLREEETGTDKKLTKL